DPFHLEAHGKAAVNYNRDIEAFPLLNRILSRIRGEEPLYRSPTDMGVNRAGFGITNDEVVRQAAVQEVIRRYFRYACEYALGLSSKETVQRVEIQLKSLGVAPEDRTVVVPARQAAIDAERDGKGHDNVYCGAAIELEDGMIVVGKNSPVMHAASSLLLNSLKKLADLPDPIHLLAPNILKSIAKLKSHIGQKSASLDLEETLIALSISATSNPSAQKAIEKLTELRDCEVHMTHIPTPGDEAGLRRLGVNLTSDANFAGKNLFIS
ncbi:DUF1846 family protein, partial [candidate division KSB1 bacterium]|nr:DUF1846 family protein [candidate division KSB1 bacterium]